MNGSSWTSLWSTYFEQKTLPGVKIINVGNEAVQLNLKKVNVPVVQIDEAMMEEAVQSEGKILVIATHGPTVKSTQSLLQETAG